MAERMRPRSRLLHTAWSKDLRFGARTLLRYPWTHGAALLILALSLGAVLSMLSLVDELLWSPLPGIAEPERTGWLFGTRGEEGSVDSNRDAVTWANVLYYQEHGRSFASVAWFTGGNRVLLDKGEPDELGGWAVSGDFFRLFGTKPLLGRLVEPGDAVVGARRVVVLGEEFWRRRFGADPAVVGTSLNLNGTQHVVVGICPAGLFRSLGRPNSIWVAHQATAAERSDRQMQVPAFVRLKDGVTFADANRELAAASQAIALAHTETDKGMGVQALPLPAVLTRFRPLAFALVSAALLVLGVAGANTANLLLAQTTERARELAIRQALGADFWTVMRQWCVQVGALMLLGIGLGTLLGRWALDAVVASMPDSLKPAALGLPEWTIGWRSWLTTVAIAGGTTLFIGLVPARQALRIQLSQALRDGGGGALGKARGKLTRRLLIAVQVTLASALTLGAACAYHYYIARQERPLGFEPAGVTLFRLPGQGREADERAQFQERLTRVLSTRGAVARGVDAEGSRSQEIRLALADSLPLDRMRTRQEFYVEGTPRPDRAAMASGRRVRVSPDYFATLGIPVLAGRTFSEHDAPDTPCAVAFSESLGASVFGASPAVGRRIHLATTEPRSGIQGGKAEQGADTVCEVVAVVGDVYDVIEGRPGALYFAIAQWPAPDNSILLVRGADRRALDALRWGLRRSDPAQVVGERLLVEDVESALWGPRILATLFTVLAGMGFVLAAIGTYAILAHTASVRRAELGLRAVLGARPRQLLWLVIADTLPVGAVGILLGLGSVGWGVMAFGGFSPEGWAYGLSLALMAALLAGSALLSARRVLALSPAVALRRR